MSLKAKIEAVIYASEEPVTLAQLMGLLGEEAQAELDALDANQTQLALEPAEAEAGDPDLLNAEALSEPGTGDNATATEQPEIAAEDTAALQEATPENVEAAEAATTKEDNAKAVAAEAKKRERRLREFFRELLDTLARDYTSEDRGLELREVAGGFRLATKPEYHDAVRGFVKSLKPPLKLSLQALETLAVVAYKQPVTAPEVAEIRGVDSGGVLGSLLTRKLIQTAGRKAVIGRPMLYKTSKEFLVRFGLKDINELPSIEEFEKMAGELNEAIQEEIPMDDARESVSVEMAGDSAPVDEINAVPEPAQPAHESADEVVDEKEADTSVPVPGEGVEPNANVHEAQADGIPEETDEDQPAS